MWLPFEEAALGTTRQIHFRQPVACTRCQRTGVEPGSSGQPCARCRGEKLEFRPTKVMAMFPVGLAEKARVRLKLLTPEEAQTIPEADEEFLSLVVHDHLHGVDIQKAYPAFYQKLQRQGSLRDAFLESVEMAQEETEEETP
jgi:hypothetical protein